MPPPPEVPSFRPSNAGRSEVSLLSGPYLPHVLGTSGIGGCPAASAAVRHTGSVTDPAPDAGTGETLDPRDVDTVLDVLRRGTLEIEGRLLDASNATLYCSLECDGVTAAV